MIEDPSKPGEDWEAMAPYWEQVDTILAGAHAMRKAGKKYLPKFPNETDRDYRFRAENAKFTNVFRDIVEGLASKPFAQEVAFASDASARMLEMFEDVDGRGNNLHVFAGETFFAGIAHALDWILIDYTRAEGLRTVEEERAAGVRPYWVHVPASAVIDIESKVMQGREQLTLVKILEAPDKLRIFRRTVVARDDGSLTPVVTWEVLRKNENEEWVLEDGAPMTIDQIPMVPFITGRRKGSKWRFHPPMRDAADLQVELYQQETALKHIKALTCFPMLAGNGVTPATDGAGNPKAVPVGPQAVLYAPPGTDGSHGEWQFITPAADVLRFLSDDVDKTVNQLRELGRQPLTAQSGNLTKITTAVAAAKGNSAVQAWALALKDALEQALVITAKWLAEPTSPEVRVFTDFGVDAFEDKAPEWLIKARENGDISGATLRAEMKRYGILSPEFDEESERERLLADSIIGIEQA